MRAPYLEIIIIVACAVPVLVVAGRLVLGLFRPAFRAVATPSPVQLGQYESATVSIVLQRKPWSFGEPVDESATFIVHPSSAGIVSIGPTLGTTNAEVPGFTLTITGLQAGADMIRISATPILHTTAIPLQIPVEVTADPEAPVRRIRHTAAALSGTGPGA